MVHEGTLQRRWILGRAKPFDRRHAIAFVHRRQRQAAVDADAVDDHRTGPALPVIAALFRTGQAEIAARAKDDEN